MGATDGSEEWIVQIGSVLLTKPGSHLPEFEGSLLEGTLLLKSAMARYGRAKVPMASVTQTSPDIGFPVQRAQSCYGIPHTRIMVSLLAEVSPQIYGVCLDGRLSLSSLI